jgi:hypothetical protein
MESEWRFLPCRYFRRLLLDRQDGFAIRLRFTVASDAILPSGLPALPRATNTLSTNPFLRRLVTRHVIILNPRFRSAAALPRRRKQDEGETSIQRARNLRRPPSSSAGRCDRAIPRHHGLHICARRHRRFVESRNGLPAPDHFMLHCTFKRSGKITRDPRPPRGKASCGLPVSRPTANRYPSAMSSI